MFEKSSPVNANSASATLGAATANTHHLRRTPSQAISSPAATAGGGEAVGAGGASAMMSPLLDHSDRAGGVGTSARVCAGSCAFASPFGPL